MIFFSRSCRHCGKELVFIRAKLYVKTDLIVVTRTHYADLAADAAIERERKAEHQAIQALFDDDIDDGINIIVGPNRQNDGDQHNNNVEIL